jgi:hypothetical protein
LQYSVIRRAGGVTIAFIVGHTFNYALFWGADRILPDGRFGLFYTAVLVISITMAPLTAVILVLARRLAEVGAKAGRDQAVAMTRRVLGVCLRAAPFFAAAGILLAAATPWLGIESWQVVLLIPITILVLVVSEIVRASLQSTLSFARASALWVASNACQFAFSLGALFIFGNVWSGIAGILVGCTVGTAGFLPWFGDSRKRATYALGNISLRLKPEVPMIISYSLFVLLNNIDIPVCYWMLPRVELDTYAASALLPKAIVTATFAAAQVVLPVVTAQRISGVSFRLSVLKGIAFATIMATVGASLLWATIPFIQSTPLAIRGLNFELMSILAAAAVALSTLRILVVIEVALHRYVIGLAQSGAIVLFAFLCAGNNGGPVRIAELYLLISCGFLLLIPITTTILRIVSSSSVHGARSQP